MKKYRFEEDKFWDLWLMWTAPTATFLIGTILGLIASRYGASDLVVTLIVTEDLLSAFSYLVFISEN